MVNKVHNVIEWSVSLCLHRKNGSFCQGIHIILKE